MVEPDRNGHPNLLQMVRKYIKDTLGPGEEVYAQHIHRLDRPVSGIILFAKRKEVLRNLSEQFAKRKVTKRYQALTNNRPPELIGTIQHWHRKEKKKATLYVQEVEYSELAKLSYEVRPLDKRFLWDIELHTGKFHQIRAQLASLGCPIEGDVLYGSMVSFAENCIALNASVLSFSHPFTNDSMIIQNLKGWQ